MRGSRLKFVAALALAATVALAGCSGGNSGGGNATASESGTGGGTLVVDTAFSLETGDPGRNYVPTGNLVLHAVYDTLLTFQDGSEEPVPSLATVEQNDDATEFTFTIQEGRTFSDGSEVTADDVVYSLNRVKGMTESKANFLMEGITVTKVDEMTVTLSTDAPSLQLPSIVTNPSLGIVNADVVQENGGTTDDSDAAQSYLDSTSAGSGPYMIDSLSLTTQVVLVPNPDYNGDSPASYDRIVVRNVTESATQLTNLQGGDSNVAIDLNGDQLESLGDDFVVSSAPSAETIFLLINQNAEVGGVTANAKFAEAVRYALDYDALLELAGVGAEEATGVIPPSFPGALDSGVTQDVEHAKEALAESGYDGSTVKLQFPNDNPVGGVEFTPVAERIQSQLQDVGINVELAPAPFASEIDPYVNGEEVFSMWYWGPDYADTSSFLPFGPGEKVGLRAGWTAEAAPEIAALVSEAQQATDADTRVELFTQYATAMQESGPFVPLIVPGANIATDGTVTNIVHDVTWTLDLTALEPAK